MTVPTTSWDENTPAGSDNISQGDDRIRELKTQIREVINVDHDFPSSGQATDVGQHKQVTLQEQSDLGTGAVNATILGSQTASGKGELVYTDEDDNDVQITSGGYVNGDSFVDGSYDFQSTNMKYALIDLLYPVGSIYTEVTGTNPGTTFGRGTWSAFGSGTFLVGLDSGDTNFDTVLETGGSSEVTLTAAQSGLPAHTHVLNMTDGTGGALTLPGQQSSKATTNTGVTGAVSGGAAAASEAHTNLPPYTVVYFWRRTA